MLHTQYPMTPWAAVLLISVITDGCKSRSAQSLLLDCKDQLKKNVNAQSRNMDYYGKTSLTFLKFNNTFIITLTLNNLTTFVMDIIMNIF